MNEVYKIILADGTVINNLGLNGNNFISKEIIEPIVFNGNCSPVTIDNGKYEEVRDHMELVQITEVDGEWWFILRDISSEELDRIKTQSDIEYLAMMSNIDL